jgi:Mn-dependent DtxR family transcriptional regulator
LKELNKTYENYWVRKIDNYRELPGKDDLIKKFLTKHLSVDQKTASLDAYGLKHSLSNLSLTRLKKFIYFLESRENRYDFDIPKEVERFIKK